MNRFLHRIDEALTAHLTPAGRERARQVRQAAAEAMVAVDRMHMAQLLAAVGQRHLSLAELGRSASGAEPPELTGRRQQMLDALAAAIQDELDTFAQRGGGRHGCGQPPWSQPPWSQPPWSRRGGDQRR